MSSQPSIATSTTPTSIGTFTLLLFASASSYADGLESLTLPAPTTLGAIFKTLESRFPGFMAKVLSSSAVTLNLEYMDVEFPQLGGQDAGQWEQKAVGFEGWDVQVKSGDEVGVIPPVSSG